MSKPSITIELGKSPLEQRILLDGQDITRFLYGLELTLRAGHMPSLTLYARAGLELPQDFEANVHVAKAETHT